MAAKLSEVSERVKTEAEILAGFPVTLLKTTQNPDQTDSSTPGKINFNRTYLS